MSFYLKVHIQGSSCMLLQQKTLINHNKLTILVSALSKHVMQCQKTTTSIPLYLQDNHQSENGRSSASTDTMSQDISDPLRQWRAMQVRPLMYCCHEEGLHMPGCTAIGQYLA